MDVSEKRLSVDTFTENRKRLFDALGASGVLLLAAGRAPHKTADEAYPFWPNQNFFYASGIQQAEVVLVLVRDNDRRQALLFIPEPDPVFERWQGHLLSSQEAGQQSGLSAIRHTSELKAALTTLLAGDGVQLYLDHSAQDGQIQEIKSWLAEAVPDTSQQALDVAPVFEKLRMIKSEEECRMIRQAVRLTDLGIRAMIRRLKPGLKEYQLWAAFSHTLAQAGCLEPAFPSIVASGSNLFCLHHTQPFTRIEPGDLVQIDVGARVGGLCADLSRVLPASGTFTDRQRLVYAVVRRCQDTAFDTIRPGIRLADINAACRQTARDGLLEAGLIDAQTPVASFFWHSVSHHLGLDVHDVSDREAPLAPGMVLTVEPGIYLPALGIGMRLEDDVLVTDQGCRLLSHDVPREAHEIEALMGQAGCQNAAGRL